MFQKIRLPHELPSNLDGYKRAQLNWLKPLQMPSEFKPKYIGIWNATAMFMVGLMSAPLLGKQLKTCEVLLPPNGPVGAGLKILHKANVLKTAPIGNSIDESGFQGGALFSDNALISELLIGTSNMSMIDIHSGLYLLGTRYPYSANWT